MCPRPFPSRAAWVCLALLTLTDLLAMAAGSFRLAGYATVGIAAVSAGAWGLGRVYSTMRPDARIAALAFGAAYLIPFTFAAALFSYIGTSFNLPLLDAQFASADAALGLDWPAVLAFVDARPALGTGLRVAYHSSLLQVVAALVVLSAARQFARLSDFLALFTATGLVTILVSIAFPAAGAFVFHNPPVEMRDVVGQAAGVWHLEHFQSLRSGAMRTIDPSHIEGLITFPSFHTALAVITAWAFWRIRYLAWPMLVLSTVVIASTVPVGGHYFVDVFAGAAIAGACLAVVVSRPWQRAANVRLGGGAEPVLSRAAGLPAQQTAGR